MHTDDYTTSMYRRLCDASSRRGAAAEQTIQQGIVEVKAEVREVKEQLQGATEDNELALQQRLAALEQRWTTLEQQKLLLMQQQSGVSQTGSLLEGSLYADVLLECGSFQCRASLLVDLELILSEHKANQLGLSPDGATAEVELASGHSGQLVRRGAVLTMLLLEGEEEDQVKDHPRWSHYLTVWSDAGTGASSSSSSGAAPLTPGTAGSSQPSSTDKAATSPMLKIKLLSAIQQGQDSHGYDALIGARGMAALSLGFDNDTMGLYRQQTPRHFRKPSKRFTQQK